MARTPRNQSIAPTRAQATKTVRIFGVINLALGSYMILGAVATVQGMNLPGSAAKLVGGILGLAVVAIGWGPAVASGIGLILLTAWGRRLAILWGKMIVWILPVAFGLAAHGLSDFLSFSFAIIIVICLYANIVAQNLGKEEFDPAFVSISPSRTPQSDNEATQPDQEPPPLPISFECPQCGRRYTVNASLAGKKAKCKCDYRMRIPRDTGGQAPQ
ncbi:MAG: hypothetical protein Kow0099_11530 [Candidatus Abyssubacteria bacterium]